jgi:hypothetical protein
MIQLQLRIASAKPHDHNKIVDTILAVVPRQ